MGTVLRMRDSKVGVLFINYRSSHTFTTDEIANIELFANQAAVAIRNAQMYQAQQRHAQVLGSIQEMAAQVSALSQRDELDEPAISGNGYAQMMKGFEKISAMPYAEATKLVEHPIACIDCHDPQSMQLRVTRPAFLLGIRRAGGVRRPDAAPAVDREMAGRQPRRAVRPECMASRQEMRSLVCGQCHVEYYCGPKTHAVLSVE